MVPLDMRTVHKRSVLTYGNHGNIIPEML